MLDGVDETMARYFDHAAFARDLEMDHSVEADGCGGVYVFRSL
ncbi:antirestriction protein ArdA [Gordonia polyisoprenivorans]|nr:antirestriction protein ArdA [Gordonia polyisoprenivorans]